LEVVAQGYPIRVKQTGEDAVAVAIPREVAAVLAPCDHKASVTNESHIGSHLEASGVRAHLELLADAAVVASESLCEDSAIFAILGPALPCDDDLSVRESGDRLRSLQVQRKRIHLELETDRRSVFFEALGKNTAAGTILSVAPPRNNKLASILDRNGWNTLIIQRVCVDLELASLRHAKAGEALSENAFIITILSFASPNGDKPIRRRRHSGHVPLVALRERVDLKLGDLRNTEAVKESPEGSQLISILASAIPCHKEGALLIDINDRTGLASLGICVDLELRASRLGTRRSHTWRRKQERQGHERGSLTKTKAKS
jgi:hypothetical protein